MTKRLISMSLGLALLATNAAPFAVSAQTSASTQASAVAALLQQIKLLQDQINALQTQQNSQLSELVRTLRQGMSGDDVKTLQALLAADPSIYPEGIISGFFGRLTAAAVKRLQKKHGLDQVGDVGPKTLQKLRGLLSENPIAFEHATSTTDDDHGNRVEKKERRPCAITPPGHLIAPGWLKKHDGERPVVPPCQTLPRGIEKKLGTPAPTPTPPPPAADTAAPIISLPSITGVASTTTTIAWTTNEPATSKVYYGTASPLNLGSALTVGDTAFMMSHSVMLSGLVASTTYHYIVESKDAANNIATSSQAQFTTTP